MHPSIRTYLPTYLPTCIHTYLHTYIHTCMYACMHIYLQCIYIVYRIICIRYRAIIRHSYHLFTSQNEIPKQSVQIISNNNAQHPKFDMVAQFGISNSRTRTIFIPQHPAPLNSLWYAILRYRAGADDTGLGSRFSLVFFWHMTWDLCVCLTGRDLSIFVDT